MIEKARLPLAELRPGMCSVNPPSGQIRRRLNDVRLTCGEA
jgi:hypothetical protein